MACVDKLVTLKLISILSCMGVVWWCDQHCDMLVGGLFNWCVNSSHVPLVCVVWRYCVFVVVGVVLCLN